MVHTTPEQRSRARLMKRRANRAAYYGRRMQAARSPRERLTLACEYLRAVAAVASPDDVDRYAYMVAQLADEHGKDPST